MKYLPQTHLLLRDRTFDTRFETQRCLWREGTHKETNTSRAVFTATCLQLPSESCVFLCFYFLQHSSIIQVNRLPTGTWILYSCNVTALSAAPSSPALEPKHTHTHLILSMHECTCVCGDSAVLLASITFTVKDIFQQV